MRLGIFLLLSLLLLAGTATPTIAAASREPSITIRNISPSSITFSYTNAPAGASAFISATYPLIPLGKLQPGNGTVTVPMPKAILDFGYKTNYPIVMQDSAGNNITSSKNSGWLGRSAAGAPDCSFRTAKHTVPIGKPIKLSWSSPDAVSVFKGAGFPIISPQKPLAANGSMTVRPGITGILEYSLIFNSESVSQSICNLYVTVTGPEQSGTLDSTTPQADARGKFISGSAVNVKTVKVLIIDLEAGGGEVWDSKLLKVRKNRWTTKVPTLPYHTNRYGFIVYAYHDGQIKELVNTQYSK